MQFTPVTPSSSLMGQIGNWRFSQYWASLSQGKEIVSMNNILGLPKAFENKLQMIKLPGCGWQEGSALTIIEKVVIGIISNRQWMVRRPCQHRSIIQCLMFQTNSTVPVSTAGAPVPTTTATTTPGRDPTRPGVQSAAPALGVSTARASSRGSSGGNTTRKGGTSPGTRQSVSVTDRGVLMITWIVFRAVSADLLNNNNNDLQSSLQKSSEKNDHRISIYVTHRNEKKSQK